MIHSQNLNHGKLRYGHIECVLLRLVHANQFILNICLSHRSLEPLTGLAMWSSEPQIIELIKGERGLGFSILDYQVKMCAN